MALPVSVVLDRTPYGTGPLDLSELVMENSLTWSSVVPGGFASCSFQLAGDFRQLVRQVPYLSIIRVIGDTGRVLFEGQIEDLASTLSENAAGLKVGAYGLQNILKETSTRHFWSKRDMDWREMSAVPGSTIGALVVADSTSFTTSTGNFDPTDPTKSGVQVSSVGGVSVPNTYTQQGEWVLPIGLTPLHWLGSYALAGSDSNSTKWYGLWSGLLSGTWTNITSTTTVGPATFTLGMSDQTALRVGASQRSGAAAVLAAGNTAQFYDMRLLGVLTSEDTPGGFYGGTLLESIIGTTDDLGLGVIESGSDFTIEHLDASTNRTLLELVIEVADYYAREWAVWEDALFHWTSPNLNKHEWIVPISQLAGMDLDASVQNSQSLVIIDYTDAASGLGASAQAVATDRRNPYVLNGRFKSRLVSPGFAMTSNTAAQLASKIMQDLGYGPVPAAGTIRLSGETLVQHAQGNAAKAWEIRAGDNVTIPELPLADVFTQDGRGECLFHVVSAESSASSGEVTLSLDSYGSKRSDVLLARLAAVTQALGG